MKKIGKVGRQWLKTRREWIILNPPNHQGYYICGICGRWVDKDEVEIDHIDPRSHAVDRRFDLSNLQATHSYCNRKKGSKH